jgi:hypothetical protein
MLGVPLFFPNEIIDGKSYGIVSNPFVAHNVAASGFLNKSLSWKGMVTGSRHDGTMRNPYPSRQITISGFAEVEYNGSVFPVYRKVLWLLKSAGRNHPFKKPALLTIVFCPKDNRYLP